MIAAAPELARLDDETLRELLAAVARKLVAFDERRAAVAEEWLRVVMDAERLTLTGRADELLDELLRRRAS